ncbi:MAG: cysteine--tRNA ligase [Bacillota bacterium]|nr:cysteine--tRNA ligase [Bacillota bacterium]
MAVYDTMSRSKRELQVREPGTVSIYVCGVTPYDEAHIGHARPSVVWDAIRRYLEYRGYRVHLVQNFTDIDDKVIARARELGRDPLELSGHYVGRYLEDMAALGVKPADHYPRVSQHMSEILEMVKALVEKGYAYESAGDVYFRVISFPGYGKLSGRSVEELRAGARVEPGEAKESPEDFALWKAARPGEPAWPSPWGPGRPGWHIECSAMALRYLGNGFDMHGGGNELIFPHHENEIAQSEAFTGEAPFVRYWLHNGLVTMREEKMSKSLKNFVTIRDLLREFPAGAIRVYLLSAHYRAPLEFDPARLQEARRAWERLQNAVRSLDEVLTHDVATDQEGLEVAAGMGAGSDRVRDRFHAAMDDDFNTPQALAALFDLARAGNSAVSLLLRGGPLGLSGEAREGLTRAHRTFEQLGGVLGVVAPVVAPAPAEVGPRPAAVRPGDQVPGERVAGEQGVWFEELLDILVEVRTRARQEKSWALADLIRERLGAMGIALEDTPLGTRWRLRSREGGPV